MPLTIQFDDDQARRLEELAKWLNVSPQEFVKAVIEEFTSRSNPKLDNAVDYVLTKNRELYQRLAQRS